MPDGEMGEALQGAINKYFPFLMEVRRRLLFVAAVFLTAMAVGFANYERIVKLALKLLDLEGVNVVFTSPFQYFDLAVSAAIAVGVVVTLPLIIVQLVTFLKPALAKKEYRLVAALMPFGLILFGVGFGYGAVMMKYVMGLFYEQSLKLSIGNLLDVSTLLSTILMTSSLMGVAFEFPVVLTMLMHLKVVKYRVIAKQRMFVYVAAVVFAALMPPTDLVSLALLTFPLVFLFELTLLLNKVFLKTHL